MPLLAIAEISRIWLVSIAEQAGFEFYLVKHPKDRFSRDMAQIMHNYCPCMLQALHATCFFSRAS